MHEVSNGRYVIGNAKIEFPQPNPPTPIFETDQRTHGIVNLSFNRDLTNDLLSGLVVTVFSNMHMSYEDFVAKSLSNGDNITSIPYELFSQIQSDLIKTDIPVRDYRPTETGVEIDTTHIGKEKELDPRNVEIERGYILEDLYVTNRFYAEGSTVVKSNSVGYDWNECDFCDHTTTQQTLQEYHGIDPVVTGSPRQGFHTDYVFDKICFLKILTTVEALLDTVDSQQLFVELI